MLRPPICLGSLPCCCCCCRRGGRRHVRLGLAALRRAAPGACAQGGRQLAQHAAVTQLFGHLLHALSALHPSQPRQQPRLRLVSAGADTSPEAAVESRWGGQQAGVNAGYQHTNKDSKSDVTDSNTIIAPIHPNHKPCTHLAREKLRRCCPPCSCPPRWCQFQRVARSRATAASSALSQ